MRRALLLIALGLGAPSAGAQPAGGSPPAGGGALRGGAEAFFDSSLLAWADAIAAALDRAADEGFAVELVAGDGVDPRRLGPVLGPRLREALALRGLDGGPLRVVLQVSREDGHFWAVGVVAGPTLAGPLAAAAAWPADRELDALLTAGRPAIGQAAWTWVRLGAVPGDALDVAIGGPDRPGTIVVLTVGAVLVQRWSPEAGRPGPEAGPWPLPAARWPRVPEGRLAWEGDSLHVWTSAGHALQLDPDRGILGSAAGVLLPQPGSTPPIPAVATGPGLLTLPEAPTSPVRGWWRWRTGGGIAQLADGRLVAQDASVGLPDGPVGDRPLLADLDGDGDDELVVAATGAPGEPDTLWVLGLGPGPPIVLFQASLEDGSVAAAASGDLDRDGRLDVVVLERGRQTSVLWHLERR